MRAQSLWPLSRVPPHGQAQKFEAQFSFSGPSVCTLERGLPLSSGASFISAFVLPSAWVPLPPTWWPRTWSSRRSPASVQAVWGGGDPQAPEPACRISMLALPLTPCDLGKLPKSPKTSGPPLFIWITGMIIVPKSEDCYKIK